VSGAAGGMGGAGASGVPAGALAPAAPPAVAAAGVVAVVRAPSAAAAVQVSEAALRGGVRAVEVTFTTPGAAEAIAELHARHGEALLLGAGTLRSGGDVDAARQAGARFLVSPGLDERLVAAMVATGLPALAGVCTPSEAMRAAGLGLRALKLFPAGVGGVGLLRALREPFPDLAFMPTGGVTAENLGEWLAAGAFAVGAGGSLCPPGEVAAGRFDAIERRARAFSDALAAARGEAAAEPRSNN
jgi:2-dehydro-3-deoxyphosphogluconate aldolase / (4S)-4-hydroxy-2-oxoglutarate aldolase